MFDSKASVAMYINYISVDLAALRQQASRTYLAD